jgi:hypothetical protein
VSRRIPCLCLAAAGSQEDVEDAEDAEDASLAQRTTVVARQQRKENHSQRRRSSTNASRSIMVQWWRRCPQPQRRATEAQAMLLVPPEPRWQRSANLSLENTEGSISKRYVRWAKGYRSRSPDNMTPRLRHLKTYRCCHADVAAPGVHRHISETPIGSVTTCLNHCIYTSWGKES